MLNLKKRESLFIILTVIISVNFATAQNFDWTVGESYNYLFTDYRHSAEINSLLDISYEYESFDEAHLIVNITQLNSLEKEITYQTIYPAGQIYEYNVNFDVDSICSYLKVDSVFHLFYIYSEKNQQLYLYGFDFSLFEEFFIESNWTKVNEYLINLFDSTSILYVNNDITPKYEITLGEFLNSIKFKINEKNTLDQAIDILSQDNPHKWRFEYDLSNFIYYPKWNQELQDYEFYPFKLYKYIVELEYSSTGVLEVLGLFKEIKINTDISMIDIEDEYRLEMESTRSTPLSNFLVIPLVFVSITVLDIIRRRF